MLNQHPLEAEFDTALVAGTVAALQECASICTLCADSCLHEESVVEMRTCITLNQDCASICTATAQILSRRIEGVDEAEVTELLRTCARICEACSRECARHAGHMEHCAICAEACRECANACEQLLDSMQA